MLRWSAVLSDGREVVQDQGEFMERPGESLPWRKLCEYSTQNNLHLTSLTLLINGRELNIPTQFGKFALGKYFKAPHAYSLQYSIEMDNIFGGGSSKEYVDVISHYEDFLLHYIHSVDDQDSYLLITEGDEPIVTSPRFSELTTVE